VDVKGVGVKWYVLILRRGKRLGKMVCVDFFGLVLRVLMVL